MQTPQLVRSVPSSSRKAWPLWKPWQRRDLLRDGIAAPIALVLREGTVGARTRGRMDAEDWRVARLNHKPAALRRSQVPSSDGSTGVRSSAAPPLGYRPACC